MNVFIHLRFSKERSAVSKQRGINILSVGVERTHLLDVVVGLVHKSASETFYPEYLLVFFIHPLQISCLVDFRLASRFFWGLTQRVVAASYRRFGTACRARLEGPRIKNPLMM
jgi:hypothetical protein